MFICAATMPIYTIVINLDLLLQLTYGTTCNSVNFEFFYHRIQPTYSCALGMCLYAVEINLDLLLQLLMTQFAI
jgi:hypothetical protein